MDESEDNDADPEDCEWLKTLAKGALKDYEKLISTTLRPAAAKRKADTYSCPLDKSNKTAFRSIGSKLYFTVPRGPAAVAQVTQGARIFIDLTLDE
jgi:hypothetical protein